MFFKESMFQISNCGLYIFIEVIVDYENLYICVHTVGFQENDLKNCS